MEISFLGNQKKKKKKKEPFNFKTINYFVTPHNLIRDQIESHANEMLRDVDISVV